MTRKLISPFLLALSALLTGCGQSDAEGQQGPGVVTLTVADKPEKLPEAISYNRDIRPILSDKCFACHGPDKAAREYDLRLDMPGDGADYFGAMSVIEPGNPDASELVRRVYSKKSKTVMPPPAFKVDLTEREKALLKAWIEQGAEYEPHWSFVALPAQVEPPKVQAEQWVRDEMDRFVLARLEQQGLSPSEEASRERWLRRVSYDLTGLPPTPQQIESFVEDQGADAYEKVVDRLLASPHYGERMAVPWLDMARYADTYGYTVDGFRAMWPWRDWVVKAFNDNLPYDKFLTWQLAGDLLDKPGEEQVLATAFNRLHRMNAEGGAIAEEWRNEGVADRLHTFGTAFMGLTLECARCHDHRYDPISQANYYELFAFFNSIDESGTVEFQRSDIVPPPSMLLPSDDQRAELERLGQEVAEAERSVAALMQARESAYAQWLASKPGEAVIPDTIGDYSFDALDGNKLPNAVKDGKPGSIGQHQSTHNPEPVAGHKGEALRFDGDNYAQLPGMNDIDRWTPFTVSLWFKVDELDDGSPRVIVKRTSGTDVGPYGFDLMLDGGRVVARAYRHWPGNAIGVRTGAVVEPGRWVHVVWRYDGSSRAAGLSLVVNGEPAELEVVRDGPLLKTVGGGRPFGPGAKDLIIAQRFRDRGLSGGVVDEVKLIRRSVSDIEAAHLFDGVSLTEALKQPDDQKLRGYYLSAVDEQVRAARKALEAKRQAYVQHENKVPEIAVMREMPEPRPTHVLSRGLYDAERTEANRVHRDTPEALPAMAEGTPHNRLGLAAWLADPNHPLTARVAVNRLWQQCFGTGLVSTVDNFGLQGALPTHPELLDYLALHYMENGWDTKQLLKRIVLSATYRQDSSATPEQWKDDPANALLARGPARRLEAEMLRDTALAASGLLVERLGGEPAYPYQPEGLWKEVSGSQYRVGKGESLYRRSLYTVWKRAVPMPNMMAFDTPTRESCTAERSATNTPLQALVLLNDIQYVEATRVLAERVMKQSPDVSGRIELGFQRLTGRLPKQTELARLLALYQYQLELFEDKPDEAQKLLAFGQSKRDASLDAVEHAATAVTMHAILNLDATITLR